MRTERLSPSEMERFLKSRSSGVLASCLGEIPYCVPMAYGYDGDSVYFIITHEGRILNYINRGANVACFTVFESGREGDSYISVVLEGPVSKVEGQELMHAVSAMEKQLRKPKGSLTEKARDSGKAGIYKLEIRSRSGRKKSGGML